MAQRKLYNSNTKYGRRKLREEFERNYAQKSDSEKADLDRNVAVMRIILFIVAAIIILIIISLGGKVR